MTKKQKPNLSPSTGIAKNKRVLIIIVLLLIVSLGIVGLVFFKRENNILLNDTKYYTGSLYSANHSANMFDYAYEGENLIISPINVNSSLAVIYNATDNNSYKEIKNYFGNTSTKVNEEMNTKLTSLTEEQKEETIYNELYNEYINEFYNKSYENLTLNTIHLLTAQDKKDLLLLIKKINLVTECLEGTTIHKEKFIKSYTLTEDELINNDYSIKEELEKIITYYESYRISNNVNNYTEIYTKDITISEDFTTKTNTYQYKLSTLEENATSNAKIINENIKIATEEQVTRAVDEKDITESEFIVINTMHFEYKWDESFKIENIVDTEFYNNNEQVEAVEMMYEVQSTYLENNHARGFKKEFENGKYSFVAVLPKNTEDFNLSSLDLDSFLVSEKEETVLTGMPKMTYQSEIDVKKLLSNYNINEIFTDKGNFTKLTETPIYIDQMTQKISLTIAEKGTVESSVYSSSTNTLNIEDYENNIILNRPYAYLIINNETNDILFIGKVVRINESN